jgi:hypothetical protein
MRRTAITICLLPFAFAQAPLQFQTRNFEKKARGCEVSFQYPEIVSVPTTEAANRINAAILRTLLQKIDWRPADSDARSMDEYADRYLDDCDELRVGLPASRPVYERKIVTNFRATAPVFSFRCDANDGRRRCSPVRCAGAMGATEIAIPYTEMRRLLKPGLPL